jgi:hypothetical protein
MLILNKFREETHPFFYFDEYDETSYTDTMYIDYKTYFKIAQPEAMSTNPKTGQIVLRLYDNGRPLFKEIEGMDFVEQFGMYCNLFYNYRFGETTEALLQAILRQSRLVKGVEVNGANIFKNNYEPKHHELLTELIEKKRNAMKPSEQRLYNVLFTIVREEFATAHNFIK